MQSKLASTWDACFSILYINLFLTNLDFPACSPSLLCILCRPHCSSRLPCPVYTGNLDQIYAGKTRKLLHFVTSLAQNVTKVHNMLYFPYLGICWCKRRYPIFTDILQGEPDWACPGLAGRSGWTLLRQNCRGNPPDLQPRHHQGLNFKNIHRNNLIQFEHEHSLEYVGIRWFEDGPLLGPPGRDTGHLAGSIWLLPSIQLSSLFF